MAKALLRLSSVLLSLILLSTSAYSISIGSVVKNDFAEIKLDESAKFKMLFWNSGSDSYMMRLSAVDYPKGWIVIIDPDEFFLNRSEGEEYISLPYMSENIRAKVVNVFVKPERESTSGNYSVTIVSDALYDTDDSLTVVPKISSVLKISLEGIEKKEAVAQSPTEAAAEDDAKETDSEKESDSNFLILVFILIILGTAMAVYKKS